MHDQFFIAVDKCNLHCDFCWYERGVSSYQPCAVSLGVLESWFDSCREVTPLRCFGVTGGEPTLLAELIDILKLASRYFDRLLLMTNATRVDQQLAERLAHLDVEVHVSLDACTSGYHQEHRGAERLTRRGLQNLEQAGVVRRSLVSTIGRANVDQVAPLRTLAADHGFDIEFHPLAVDAGDERSLTRCTPLERATLFQSLRPWAEADKRRLVDVGMFSAVVRDGRPPPLAGCHFAEASIVIDADGTVRPCFVKADVSLGNIREHTAAAVQKRRRLFLTSAAPGRCVEIDCLGVL